MNIPADLKYLKTHEYLRLEGDIATIGITQSQVRDRVRCHAQRFCHPLRAVWRELRVDPNRHAAITGWSKRSRAYLSTA